MFEDTYSKVDSLTMLLGLKLKAELDVELVLVSRSDESMLTTDLVSTQFNLILVDDDLGNDLWGNQVIESIMEETSHNPDYRSIKIIYYSSGTDIAELKAKTKKFGQLKCITYDELSDTVFNLVKAKY